MNVETAWVTRYMLIGLQYGIVVLLYWFVYRLMKILWYDMQSETRVRHFPLASHQQAVLFVINDAGIATLPKHPIELADHFTIGRTEHNDMMIPETWVSGEHATIYRREGRYYLRDLHSTNGTFYHSIRLADQDQLLQNGDIIRVGDVTMRFEE